MAFTYKTCKVCGKKYEGCSTPNWGVFRWRDVACSKDCAMIYIENLEKARATAAKAEEKTK